MKRATLILMLLFCVNLYSHAQNWSIGTNIIELANFGTLNINGSTAVARRCTLDTEWRYNPWTFKHGQPDQFQIRTFTGSLGTRFWPWHILTGW